MSKRHSEGHKSHPMAYALVYGFGFVSLLSSSLGAFAAYKLFFQSKLVASVVFSIILHRFFRIAGGIKGINRTVGDGKLSVHQELLAKGDEKPPGTVRVVVISDTHCHNLEQLPKGDILVHCGDFTMKGSSNEIQQFCDWLEKQPFEHKILIAGNHDMGLEFLSTEEVKAAHARLQSICTLLQNSGTSVNGLKFWGSPQTPYISKTRRMGFQDASENLAPFWDKIPENIDILITHGPPQGYGDRILLGKHVGCPELMKRVAKVKPRYHLFGHIHEAYGTYPSALGCLFINAAICNTLYNPIHPPIVLDIPVKSS